MMLKTAHKMALTALVLVCTCGGSFAADAPKYDRKIEAAVKQIVAKKAGPIRGAYDIHTKAVTIAEFQGPVRPAIVAVAALPEVFETVDNALVVSSQTPANNVAAPEIVVASAPIIETNASVKLVQVAAVANRKVRVLSSFLYY
jgi:hypothetical protein